LPEACFTVRFAGEPDQEKVTTPVRASSVFAATVTFTEPFSYPDEGDTVIQGTLDAAVQFVFDDTEMSTVPPAASTDTEGKLMLRYGLASGSLQDEVASRKSSTAKKPETFFIMKALGTDFIQILTNIQKRAQTPKKSAPRK
jgi:hypothetical protein